MAAITGTRVPFVNAKILHSKTHCGDYIEVSQLDTLARELAVLSAGMKPGTRLAPAFVRQLRELIAAARQESNPIDFGSSVNFGCGSLLTSRNQVDNGDVPSLGIKELARSQHSHQHGKPSISDGS